jgi:AcrR family transcriptional regulator
MNDIDSILVKVSELYKKYGIKSVTMDDVARELGVSKKTLYQYVSDKTELVGKVVDKVMDCSFSSIEEMEQTGSNAIEQLIEVSRRVNIIMKDHSPSYEYDLKKYYPEIYARLMSERRAKMYESMLANIRRGKKEGVYRDELNEEIITKLHIMRMESLRESEFFKPEELHASKFFREILVYHIHGLASEEGRKVLEKNMEKLMELEEY